MKRLLTFRHAPVKGEGICYGHSDLVPIWEPEKCAALIKESLTNQPKADFIWSSPLKRCRQIAEGIGFDYRTDSRLMEVNFGQWEGLTWDEVHLQFPAEMAAWGVDWYSVAPPGGESAASLENRVADWVSDLCEGTHLVFTHAGVIRSLRVICESRPWSEVMKIAVPHLTLEVFQIP